MVIVFDLDQQKSNIRSKERAGMAIVFDLNQQISNIRSKERAGNGDCV